MISKKVSIDCLLFTKFESDRRPGRSLRELELVCPLGDCNSAWQLTAAAEDGRWRLFCSTGECRPVPGGRRTPASLSSRSRIVCFGAGTRPHAYGRRRRRSRSKRRTRTAACRQSLNHRPAEHIVWHALCSEHPQRVQRMTSRT